MKITKLVFGILSCVLFCIIMFQSCAASVAESLSETGSTASGSGLLTGILILAAGVVMLVSYKKIHGGGTIASIVLYALAGLIGVLGHGIYGDLLVWGVLSLIIACLLVIFYIVSGKQQE